MAIVATTGTSICSHFAATAGRHADAPALATLTGESLTWGEYHARVRAAAAGMAGLGLGRGDVIACWLTNRPEFHVADAAALHLGATSFSIYNTYTVEQARHVVADAGARLIVTEAAFVEKALALRDGGHTELQHVVCVDGADPKALGWDELLDAASPAFDFEAAWRAVEARDLATLIYTSGTTGPPKGVELTHANLEAQTLALRDRLGFPTQVRAVSFLPMAHVAERLCTHYFPMFLGWSVTSCPVAGEVLGALRAVRPGYFFSPPRVWEKLRAGVLAGLEPAARERLAAAQQRALAGDRVADSPTAAAARASVGLDALEVAIVGAAPSPPELIAFWHALGVPLSELYGMSETTGVATVAGPGAVRIGTVGPPLPVCEVRLSAEREILMRGPVVTRGYRNLPEANAAAFDADGWLHSGDVGEWDADGYLRVVDRIKELIISSAGKNMSPANIEAALRAGAALVGNVCVIGDRRPFNVALVTLDREGAATLLGEALSDVRWPERHPVVLELVRREIARGNDRLARVEQVKRFALLAEEWVAGGDELTPTMKLKRRAIAHKFAGLIDGLYDGSAGIDVEDGGPGVDTFWERGRR